MASSLFSTSIASARQAGVVHKMHYAHESASRSVPRFLNLDVASDTEEISLRLCGWKKNFLSLDAAYGLSEKPNMALKKVGMAFKENGSLLGFCNPVTTRNCSEIQASLLGRFTLNDCSKIEFVPPAQWPADASLTCSEGRGSEGRDYVTALYREGNGLVLEGREIQEQSPSRLTTLEGKNIDFSEALGSNSNDAVFLIFKGTHPYHPSVSIYG